MHFNPELLEHGTPNTEHRTQNTEHRLLLHSAGNRSKDFRSKDFRFGTPVYSRITSQSLVSFRLVSFRLHLTASCCCILHLPDHRLGLCLCLDLDLDLDLILCPRLVPASFPTGNGDDILFRYPGA